MSHLVCMETLIVCILIFNRTYLKLHKLTASVGLEHSHKSNRFKKLYNFELVIVGIQKQKQNSHKRWVKTIKALLKITFLKK